MFVAASDGQMRAASNELEEKQKGFSIDWISQWNRSISNQNKSDFVLRLLRCRIMTFSVIQLNNTIFSVWPLSAVNDLWLMTKYFYCSFSLSHDNNK